MKLGFFKSRRPARLRYYSAAVNGRVKPSCASGIRRFAYNDLDMIV